MVGTEKLELDDETDAGATVGTENVELADDETVGTIVVGIEKDEEDDDLGGVIAGMENEDEEDDFGDVIAGMENEELWPDCAYDWLPSLGGKTERNTVANAITPNVRVRRRLCSRCERTCVFLIMAYWGIC